LYGKADDGSDALEPPVAAAFLENCAQPASAMSNAAMRVRFIGMQDAPHPIPAQTMDIHPTHEEK
jgi:hypothetical protein